MRQEQDEELIRDPGERVEKEDDFRPEYEFSRQEKRWVVLGALKGALLIAAAYLGGMAFIIWLMVTFWK